MSQAEYKGSLIQPFEEAGQWIARIRRKDGAKIKISIPESESDFLDTEPPQHTHDAAIDLAKQAIDGGGMN
jgi:hypothetical protein